MIAHLTDLIPGKSRGSWCYQVTRLPGYQVTRLPGYQVTRLPGYLVTRLPGYQVTRFIRLNSSSVNSSVVNTENISRQSSLPPRYGITRLPGYQVTRLPGYQITRLPGYQVTRLPGYQVTRLPFSGTLVTDNQIVRF